MIDLHNHLLPNIDDGSRSAQQSAAVLRDFATQGVKHVVLTPHVQASDIDDRADEFVERRAAAFRQLQQEAPAAPTLHLGFEIMLDEPLPPLAAGDRRFSLAGSRYYLVEFPPSIVGSFVATALRQIAQTGVIPLVAHPERYAACRPDVVSTWREAGGKMQLDATTLIRSSDRGRRARALLAAGLADLVAADNHGDSRSVATAQRYLAERGREQEAAILVERNPRAVIEDADMVAPPRVEIQESWLERVKRLMD